MITAQLPPEACNPQFYLAEKSGFLSRLEMLLCIRKTVGLLLCFSSRRLVSNTDLYGFDALDLECNE